MPYNQFFNCAFSPSFVVACLPLLNINTTVHQADMPNRECFCGPYVNSLAVKLSDANCSLPCDGNQTQICGGSLKLSVYIEKVDSKGAGSNLAGDAPVGSILALGIAMGTLLLLA